MTKTQITHSEPDIEKLENLADWMDSRFHVPGTSIRFGLDSLLGLIPGVGDTVTLVSTSYIIGVAHSHNVPFHIKLRMVWNALLDWLIGLIPLIGDIFDVGWKANKLNVELIKNHIAKQP